MGAAAGFREHYIPVTEADEWRSALKGVPHAFAHTVECCAAIQLTTGWPTFLYVAACAGGRVVCPLTERTYGGFVDVVTPYQFSGFSITGAFPDVAPRVVDLMSGAPAWADAGVIVPWTVWKMYGDTRIIDEHWVAMERWMNWLLQDNPDLLWRHDRGDEIHARSSRYGDDHAGRRLFEQPCHSKVT